MKAIIRNRSFQARQMVATVSAGKKLGVLHKDSASDLLYDSVRAQEVAKKRKAESPPIFRRKLLTSGTFIFLPCNPNAQAMLDSMTKEQRIAFVLSANDPKPEPNPAESRRIEAGRAVKAVPRGRYEGEVFHPLVHEREQETALRFTAKLAGCKTKDSLPTALDKSVPRRSGGQLPRVDVNEKTRELIEFIQGKCKELAVSPSSKSLHHEAYDPRKTHV